MHSTLCLVFNKKSFMHVDSIVLRIVRVPSGVFVHRYIEALRAQMKEKLEQERVELPPLCCCGDSFWDSHPDTCANNCVFYNNPKGGQHSCGLVKTTAY